jgi:3-deoxy-manno-octulosonate cytidylyltransferase (CMP-KDO synthetase)
VSRIIGIIPARYQSSRFPGKPLVPLQGKAMILHVAEIAIQALGRECVYVATDDNRIADLVNHAGYQVLMTSSEASTGTDRLWEAAQQVSADYFINIQGDEPLLDPNDIIRVVKEKCRRVNGIVNGMCYLSDDEDPWNRNIPKVAVSENNQLLYMSRLPIPGYKAAEKRPEKYLKQVCIYAFNYKELQLFGEAGRKTYLEEKEDIEILRFLDLSIPVYMVHTGKASLAIDVPGDVPAVEAAMLHTAANSLVAHARY